jgi:type II secretory pathway pseudopilin PulG
MVVLVVAITVLNILVAAALPHWGTLLKRTREEELIFRGLQYAEGIRIFQRRFGRLPVRLEELVEVEPRCMRQLYKDPMTADGKWGLLFAAGGAPRPNPGGQPGQPNPQNPGQNPPGGETDDGGTVALPPTDGDGRQVTVGPIQGVFSPSEDESLLVFNGEEQYNRWHFTLNLVTAPIGAPGQPGNQLPNLNVRWLGRPLPGFLQQPGGQFPGTGLNPLARGGNRPRPLPNTLGNPPPQPRRDGRNN